jgi:hypothetical protein
MTLDSARDSSGASFADTVVEETAVRVRIHQTHLSDWKTGIDRAMAAIASAPTSDILLP